MPADALQPRHEYAKVGDDSENEDRATGRRAQGASRCETRMHEDPDSVEGEGLVHINESKRPRGEDVRHAVDYNESEHVSGSDGHKGDAQSSFFPPVSWAGSHHCYSFVLMVFPLFLC